MKVLNSNIFVRTLSKDEKRTGGGIIVDVNSKQETVLRCKVEEVSEANPDGIKKGDTIIIPKGAFREFQIDSEMNTGFVMNNSVLCVL